MKLWYIKAKFLLINKANNLASKGNLKFYLKVVFKTVVLILFTIQCIIFIFKLWQINEKTEDYYDNLGRALALWDKLFDLKNGIDEWTEKVLQKLELHQLTEEEREKLKVIEQKQNICPYYRHWHFIIKFAFLKRDREITKKPFISFIVPRGRPEFHCLLCGSPGRCQQVLMWVHRQPGGSQIKVTSGMGQVCGSLKQDLSSLAGNEPVLQQ